MQIPIEPPADACVVKAQIMEESSKHDENGICEKIIAAVEKVGKENGIRIFGGSFAFAALDEKKETITGIATTYFPRGEKNFSNTCLDIVKDMVVTILSKMDMYRIK